MASLLVAGCGQSEARPSAPGTPRAGGSLTVSWPGEAVSFDPARTSLSNVADGNRMSAVYDVLVATDPTTGAVHPKIAESLTPESGDRTDKWLLRVRPGVRFSDGVAYDAAAVKANWERHRDPNVQSYQMMATRTIRSLEIDPNEPLVLRITLTAPNANFDHIVAGNLAFIASPAALRPDKVHALRGMPVGAGPFVLREWVGGERQVFVRNRDYWQRDRGLPYLDELVVRVEPDVARAARDLGKTSDLTISVDPENIASARQRDLEVDELQLNGGAMVLFNTLRAPFTDARARQAVALALSSTEINEVFYHGAGTPARGIFSSSSALSNTQLTAPENDRAVAQRLFDTVTANGTKPLTFTYVVPFAPATVAVSKHIQATLNTFRGVEMSISQMDVPTFIQTVRKGSDAWTIAMYQQWIDDPDPGIYDVVNSDSAGNFSGYRNPDVDQALEDARRTTDIAARREAYTRVQIRLNADMPFWVYQEAVVAALSTDKVMGLKLFNDGIVHWDAVGLRR